MIENITPNGLPYELIGQLLVLLAMSVLLIIATLAIIGAIMFVWVRGLTRLSNYMWKDCDDNEKPSLTKLKISGVARTRTIQTTTHPKRD